MYFLHGSTSQNKNENSNTVKVIVTFELFQMLFLQFQVRSYRCNLWAYDFQTLQDCKSGRKGAEKVCTLISVDTVENLTLILSEMFVLNA